MCIRDRRQGSRSRQARVAALAALGAFLYQLPPTTDDTFDAYVFSGELQLSAAALSATSTASLAMSMVAAPALCARVSLPAPAAFAVGALADAFSALARLAFVRLAPAASAAGATRLVELYVATSTTSAFLRGVAFVPVVSLGALAAPAGAEATVFGLVLTAQTAGTLVAAAIAAVLNARLRIGTPPAAGAPSDARAPDARSWDRLPAFILICCVLKLAVLIPVLPLLRTCVRLATGGGGAARTERGDELARDWRQRLSEPLLARTAARTEPGAAPRCSEAWSCAPRAGAVLPDATPGAAPNAEDELAVQAESRGSRSDSARSAACEHGAVRASGSRNGTH